MARIFGDNDDEKDYIPTTSFPNVGQILASSKLLF